MHGYICTCMYICMCVRIIPDYVIFCQKILIIFICVEKQPQTHVKHHFP